MAWDYVAKPKVCICVPHTAHVTLEWADKTYVPLKLMGPNFDKVYQLARGTPLNLSREEMVLGGMGVGAKGDTSKVTHFFFVDSDILFEQPSDVNQAISILLSMNQPIVCGVYRAKQKTGFHHAIWSKRLLPDGKTLTFDPVGLPPPPTNWFTVDVTGLGCALVKREVFEKVPRPWFEWTFDKYDSSKLGPSEDFSFFLKAKEYGYLCWIYSDVKCSHIGDLKVKFDGALSVLEV